MYRLKLLSDAELVNNASNIYSKNKQQYGSTNISDAQDLESGLYGSTKSGPCKICNQAKNCQGHYGACILPYPIITNTIILDKFIRLIQILCPVCSSFPINIKEVVNNYDSKERFAAIQERVRKLKQNNEIIKCANCKNEILLISVEGNYPDIKYYIKRTKSEKKDQLNPIVIHDILSNMSDSVCEASGFNVETFNPRNFMTYFMTIIPNKLRLKSFEAASSSITSNYRSIIEKVIPDLQTFHNSNFGLKKILIQSTETETFNKLYAQLNAYYGLFVDMTSDSIMKACLETVNKKDKKHIDKGSSMLGRFYGKDYSYFNKGIIGTRHNNSARTVVGGAPELACTKIGLPKRISNKLGFLIPIYKENIDYVKKIINKEISGIKAIRIYKPRIDESIKLKKQHLVLNMNSLEIEPGDKLYINAIPGTLVNYSRYPAIREESCSSFEIIPTNHSVVTIPLTTAPMKGADFDGDETQVYLPSSWYTDAESLLLQSATRVAKQYKDGKFVIYFTADTNFELALINKDTLVGFESVFDEFETCIERRPLAKPKRVLDIISETFVDLGVMVNYKDKVLEINNNIISDDKCKINNQDFYLYFSMIYGMNKTLKLINRIIQIGYNIAKFFPITMGNEVRFYSDPIEILKTKKQTYENMKKIERSNMSFREKTIEQTLLSEKQKVPVIQELIKTAKSTNIDKIGFLTKFQNEYYTSMVNMDFIIIDGERVKPKLANFTRTCCSFSKFSLDPASYGYINHGYASPNIKPTETFYDCMLQRKSLYEKGVSIANQGYLSKRFGMAYGNSVVDCNGGVLCNDRIINFNYGVDVRLKFNQPLIGISLSYSELCKMLNINEDDDLTLKKLHERINKSRQTYRRLTSQLKIEIVNDEFCAGFNYEQWLSFNSEEGQTDKAIIDELCEEIKKITCPEAMIQRYGLVYNERLEYYLRVKLRQVKITRDQALSIYYYFINSLISSGDSVGMKATLAISEAFTQAGLNSIHKATGGGINVEKIQRSSGFDRFEELLGNSVPKNSVLTLGFLENTKEQAEKFAKEQETLFFSDLWNKIDVNIAYGIPDIVKQIHPNISDDEFNSVTINNTFLRVNLNLAKLADHEIDIVDLIEKLKTDEIALMTGHITQHKEFMLYVFFYPNVQKLTINNLISKWKSRQKNNIIHGEYLVNCFVTQNKNTGDWLVLANEVNPERKTFENIIVHPDLDVCKCKTSNTRENDVIYGICEAESRLFEELYYTATNLSDTKNILERHYKTICDTAYADGKIILAATHSIEKHDGDYLRRIDFETPAVFFRTALESGKFLPTDDPIAAATFNDLPRIGSGFSKVTII